MLNTAPSGILPQQRSEHQDTLDPELRARARGIHAGRTTPKVWSDTGLRSHQRIAARFATYAQHEVTWLHGHGWRKWTGTHWADDIDDVRTHQILKQALESIWGDAINDRDLAADVKAANTGPGSNAVLGLARRHLHAEEMDTDPWLLNTQSGTLDLRTLELRPHRPEDRISKITAGAYRPGERSHEWQKFIAEALPDPDVRAYIRRYLGQSLIGTTQEHKLAILKGKGRNGKTVLQNVTVKALGDYAVTVSNDLLLSGRYGGKDAGNLAALMALRGARLATMSEINKGERMNEAAMKQYTGGDTITSKAMGQNYVTWEPTHSLLMLTNDLPAVQGDSYAAWARIHVVPFPIDFTGREDGDLEHRLKQDALDAVLTWAVEGLKDYQHQGLAAPAAVTAEVDAYRYTNDPVTQFIEERCYTGLAASVRKATLLQAYNEWAQQNGETHLSSQVFTPQIRDQAGVEETKMRGDRGWQGIGLRPELEG